MATAKYAFFCSFVFRKCIHYQENNLPKGAPSTQYIGGIYIVASKMAATLTGSSDNFAIENCFCVCRLHLSVLFNCLFAVYYVNVSVLIKLAKFTKLS